MKKPAPQNSPTSLQKTSEKTFRIGSKQLLLYVLSLGATSSCLADVDLQQASYYKTWTDFTVQSHGVQLAFQRTYKSRSIYQGIFGFGWCTEFEKHLEFSKDRDLILNDCKEDRPLKFRKRGDRYISDLNPQDYFMMRKSTFIRQLGKIAQTYNSEGQLVRLQFNKWPVDLEYTKNRLIRIRWAPDQFINLTFTPKDGDTLAVKAPGTAAIVYRFHNKNLVAADGDNTHIQYTYNSFHNLTSVQVGSITTEKMTYNDKNDWLTGLSQEAGCQQKFTYLAPKKSTLPKAPLFKAVVRKFCQEHLQSETQYTYQLQEFAPGYFRIQKIFTTETNLKTKPSATETSVASQNGDQNE
jgi:hypothetical protein